MKLLFVYLLNRSLRYLFTSLVLTTVVAYGQRFTPPDGESVVSKDIGGLGNTKRVVATNRHVYSSDYNPNFSTWVRNEKVFDAPTGTDIVDGRYKTIHGAKSAYFVLLNDGRIFKIQFWGSSQEVGKIDGSNYEQFLKIAGDALYVLSSSSMYISRDSGMTWGVDTAGLGNVYKNDFALDTSQTVYLATSAGLFRQSADSSIWYKVTTCPLTYTSTVFIDRRNRIFISGSNKIYFSTDNGNSWSIDTAGIQNKATKKFGDDSFGNVYAITSASVEPQQMYRSDNGTQPWVRIDGPLTTVFNPPSYKSVFNEIGGDSVLLAATAYGLYYSTDFGTTWSSSNKGIAATFIYGLAKLPDGTFVTSTNLGVFRRHAADTSWNKVFPQNIFLANCPVMSDSSGNVYTLGNQINSTNFSPIRTNWKSTDAGTTWLPDTGGISAIDHGQQAKYFVDPSGTQYYSAYDSPAKIYIKRVGENWTADTSGYGQRVNDLPTVIAVDHHGSIYIALFDITNGVGTLWKKSLSGGSWSLDTLGLNGNQVYSISADKNGNVVLGTYGNGVLYKNAGVWTPMPQPYGISAPNAFAVGHDQSGAVFAGFSYFNASFQAVWRGVYYTTNSGVTWTLVGLDSISIKFFVSDGDTLYAVTYADGIYKFSRQGVSAVNEPVQKPVSFGLFQNYPNPFNPSTMINYQLPIGKWQFVSLKVYDVLGREVITLVNEVEQPGRHSVQWDASNQPSGVYFYRLSAGSFTETKKLLLMK